MPRLAHPQSLTHTGIHNPSVNGGNLPSRPRPPIMVVDDCEEFCYLVTKAMQLAEVNQPVLTFENGIDAVRYLNGEGEYSDRLRWPIPRLVLLDIKMPRMDGFQVIAWAKAQEELRNVVFIALSASQRIEDIKRAYELGANSYLVKPGPMEELIRMAEQIRDYWLPATQFRVA